MNSSSQSKSGDGGYDGELQNAGTVLVGINSSARFRAAHIPPAVIANWGEPQPVAEGG
jgi:hypothetical protein